MPCSRVQRRRNSSNSCCQAAAWIVAVRVTTSSRSKSSASKFDSSGVSMLSRSLQVPPEHLYPTDDWRVIETRYSERFHARAETALALSNGYIGVRGAYDEGRPSLSPGT